MIRATTSLPARPIFASCMIDTVHRAFSPPTMRGQGVTKPLLKGRPLPAETRAYVAMLRPFWGGGDAPGALTAGPAKAASWKAAPLFIVPSGSLAASGLPPGEDASVEVSSSPSVRKLFAAGSQPRQLFTGSDVWTSQR